MCKLILHYTQREVHTESCCFGRILSCLMMVLLLGDALHSGEKIQNTILQFPDMLHNFSQIMPILSHYPSNARWVQEDSQHHHIFTKRSRIAWRSATSAKSLLSFLIIVVIITVILVLTVSPRAFLSVFWAVQGVWFSNRTSEVWPRIANPPIRPWVLPNESETIWIQHLRWLGSNWLQSKRLHLFLITTPRSSERKKGFSYIMISYTTTWFCWCGMKGIALHAAAATHCWYHPRP